MPLDRLFPIRILITVIFRMDRGWCWNEGCEKKSDMGFEENMGMENEGLPENCGMFWDMPCFVPYRLWGSGKGGEG